MPIENSDLNDSPALKASNEGLKGGTGDGNRFLIADLERGFVRIDAEPQLAPFDLHDMPYLPGDL